MLKTTACNPIAITVPTLRPAGSAPAKVEVLFLDPTGIHWPSKTNKCGVHSKDHDELFNTWHKHTEGAVTMKAYRRALTTMLCPEKLNSLTRLPMNEIFMDSDDDDDAPEAVDFVEDEDDDDDMHDDPLPSKKRCVSSQKVLFCVIFSLLKAP